MSSQNIHAAVALVHCKSNDSLLILRRAEHPLDPWSGHYALPGGRHEAGETLLECAIRECLEECGLELTEANLIKELPVETAGRNVNKETLVQPYLFEIPEPVELTLDLTEIDQFHWLPVSDLLDGSKVKNGKISKQYPQISFPYFPLHGRPLWGFTYKVVLDYLQEK